MKPATKMELVMRCRYTYSMFKKMYPGVHPQRVRGVYNMYVNLQIAKA